MVRGMEPLAVRRSWTKLDNAAKLFPPTRTKRDTKVFRFSCELLEDVDPEVLEEAVRLTLPHFSVYRSVMKKGLFWYYLEECALEPTVRAEYKPPLTQLYSGLSKSLLFEVTYFRRRINLEVFHVLSDGAGAIQFFRTLVGYYLIRKYEPDKPHLMGEIESDASKQQQRVDSFAKYYEKTGNFFREKVERAYKLPGERQKHLRVIEGTVPVSALRNKSREYSATITEMLTANFILSIGEQMDLRDMKRPVVISVPVNLRQFFPSETARNFFGVIYVKFDFSASKNDFPGAIEQVKRSFKSELTEEKMKLRMNQYATLEHMMIARLIPLALKDPIMRIGNSRASRGSTASFSNVGKIELPEALAKYVYIISAFDSTNRLQAVLSSFGDKFTTSFTSAFTSTDIEMNYFRRLSEMGLDVTVASNYTG